MKYEYVSLGEYCAVAHQINLNTNSKTACFFDWLVTHNESLDALLCDENEMLNSKNWRIVDGPPSESEGSKKGIRVQDLYTKLKFQHEFQIDKSEKGIWGHPVDELKVESHLPIAKEKFKYLKNKTLEKIKNSDNIFLIRCEHSIATVEEATNRIKKIESIYKKVNNKIRIAILSDSLKEITHYENNVIYPIKQGDDWKGDGSSWCEFFNYIESI